MKIWSCKIGEVDVSKLPSGSDAPMREAVETAYQKLTGQEPKFCISGWGAELDEDEREIVTDKQSTINQ